MGISSMLKTLPYNCRRLKSSAATAIASGKRVAFTGNSDPEQKESLINLDDSKDLFSCIPTTKLIASTFYLHLISNEFLVDLGLKVMKSGVMKRRIPRKAVLESIEHTFYNHFCGGKDLREAEITARKLWDCGLRALLDYGLEHAKHNASCDKNLEEILLTIESTQSLQTSPISFVVVKMTAICPPSLLRRVSDLLRWEYKDNSLHLPWKLQTLPIFADSTSLHHTPTSPESLTLEEECDMELGYQRLIKICEKSSEAGIPLLVDAEDTSIQPAIDYFTYSAALKYHADGSPLLFNTIQAYLKDARERLVQAKKAADEVGVPMGFKLVRGAYMSAERQKALSSGADSPIHDYIQDTHDCYNDCAAFMLEEIANGSGSLVLATHNLESGKLAAAKAVSLGIKKESRNLEFAQLYGMAEALSFGLRNAGFRVSKYLPYGPVEQIMPYLLRRAEENRGLFSTTTIDRQLMRKELLRRFTRLDL